MALTKLCESGARAYSRQSKNNEMKAIKDFFSELHNVKQLTLSNIVTPRNSQFWSDGTKQEDTEDFNAKQTQEKPKNSGFN